MRKAPLVILIMSVIALLLVSGCAKETRTESGDDGSSKVESTSANRKGSGATKQEETVDNTVKTFDPIPGAEKLAAAVTTDKGVIAFEFNLDKAPSTVANFITLARKGFYDGTTFHRVVENFVIQGGDPNTKTGAGMAGTGGPGYKLKAEFSDLSHLEGTVAMARSQDPDSAGSQFYICLSSQPSLDRQYTIFGQVIKGMDVVKQIAVDDIIRNIKIVDKSEIK